MLTPDFEYVMGKRVRAVELLLAATQHSHPSFFFTCLGLGAL